MTTPAPRLVVVHDVLKTWQTILDEHMPQVAAQMGWTNGREGLENAGKVRDWKVAPNAEAIEAAGTPNGAMFSPGLVDEPRKNGDRTHDAGWQIVAAVYDHGLDYDDTQLRVQRWAALIRAVTLTHPSLGGLVERTNWVGEDYDVDTGGNRNARTLGGCAVAFQVRLTDVVDLSTPRPVTRTTSSVTVTPRST
jgi:hypothetical protein